MAKDPRAFLQLAEEHRRNGRLKEAIAVCLDGLGRHPALDAARITLGRAYLESDQLELARDTLSDVFARLPEHHLAGKLLAEAQHRLGDAVAAESTCKALLVHYPRDRELEALLESIRIPQNAPAAAAGTAPAAAAPESRAKASARPPAAKPVAPAAAVRAPAASAPAAVPPDAPPSAPAPPAARAQATAAQAKLDEAKDPEPEYMPEDLGIGVARGTPPPPPVSRPAGAPPPSAVARPKGQPAPAGAARLPADAPAPGGAPAASAAPPASGDVLQTGTLADVYLRQGLVDRAIEVYRAMLRVDPGNLRARQRLDEIEAAAGIPTAAAGKAPVGRRAEGGPAHAVPPPVGAARGDGDAPQVVGEAARRRRAESIARLEGWLDTMKRGSVSNRRSEP
jgi:tetratricopeptide (TPR) repeat protein